MKFNIAIEPGTDSSAFGVVVPDLPGCFSAGNTLGKVVDNVREAIDLWCETVIEEGGDVPVAKTLAEHQLDPDFAGWIWVVVEVPVERYFRQTVLVAQADLADTDVQHFMDESLADVDGWRE